MKRMYQPAQNPATGKATKIKIKNQMRLQRKLPPDEAIANLKQDCDDKRLHNHKLLSVNYFYQGSGNSVRLCCGLWGDFE
jgi:hypothetical protein